MGSLTEELDSMQFKLYAYQEKEDEEKQRLRQIEIDKIDLNYKELHVIRSDKTTLTPMRVQHVVDNSMATDFDNIDGIVLKRYKTGGSQDSNDADTDISDDDDDFAGDPIEYSASLASNDKLEIAKRKSIQKQQLMIEQEKRSMHQQLKSLQDLDKWNMKKELDALKRVNDAKKAVLSSDDDDQSAINLHLEIEYSKTELTDAHSDLDIITPINGPITPTDDVDEDLPPLDGNDSAKLFRFRSESRWDETTIKKQKKRNARSDDTFG